MDSILSSSNILFVVIIPLSFSISPKQTESRDTLKIHRRRKTTVGKSTALKWPLFCVFLCFEMILRSFNGAVMCRIYVAPLEFGRNIINPVSNINEEVIMVLEYYYSYTCIIMKILETEIKLNFMSNFYSKFRPHRGQSCYSSVFHDAGPVQSKPIHEEFAYTKCYWERRF